MSGIEPTGGEEAARKLNELARHRMTEHILLDIRVDLMVCEIEGWDKTEYMRMLREELGKIGGN